MLGDVEQLDGAEDGLLRQGEVANGLIQRFVGFFVVVVLVGVLVASADARVLKGVVGGGACNVVAPMLAA